MGLDRGGKIWAFAGHDVAQNALSGGVHWATPVPPESRRNSIEPAADVVDVKTHAPARRRYSFMRTRKSAPAPTERQRRHQIIDLLAGHLARLAESGLTVMS
jgi:hypothetical protein